MADMFVIHKSSFHWEHTCCSDNRSIWCRKWNVLG